MIQQKSVFTDPYYQHVPPDGEIIKTSDYKNILIPCKPSRRNEMFLIAKNHHYSDLKIITINDSSLDHYWEPDNKYLKNIYYNPKVGFILDINHEYNKKIDLVNQFIFECIPKGTTQLMQEYMYGKYFLINSYFSTLLALLTISLKLIMKTVMFLEVLKDMKNIFLGKRIQISLYDVFQLKCGQHGPVLQRLN